VLLNENTAQQSVHLTLGILRLRQAFSQPARPHAGNANRWALVTSSVARVTHTKVIAKRRPGFYNQLQKGDEK